MRVLFPGSFDPVTNGHLDLIARLVGMAETVVVGVAENPSKAPLFRVEERLAMLRDVCAAWPSVEVIAYRGLTMTAARDVGAGLIVRGVRSVKDCAVELEMACANRAIGGIETVLLPAAPEWAFLSSSLVREIAIYGGEVSGLVPSAVAARLQKKRAVSKT